MKSALNFPTTTNDGAELATELEAEHLCLSLFLTSTSNMIEHQM